MNQNEVDSAQLDETTKDTNIKQQFVFRQESTKLLEVEPEVDTQHWNKYSIHPGLSKYLIQQKFEQPTDIQKLALKNQEDSQILIAETGAGKTLAYLLPVVQQITNMYRKSVGETQRAVMCVVLTPTHELAIQLQKAFTAVFPQLNQQFYLTMQVTGGMSIQKQQRQLANLPYIVFATPGRAFELLTKEYLTNIRKIVIDEADRMLEQGQFNDLTKFCQVVNETSQHVVQIVLSSATLSLPQQLLQNCLQSVKNAKRKPTLKYKHQSWTETEKNYLNILENLGFHDQQIVVINSQPQQILNKSVQEIWHFCENNVEKQHILAYLLYCYNLPTLVFCSSINECRNFTEIFKVLGFNVTMLHSKQQQKQRLSALEQMSSGSCVIFTTDVAARGIDLPNIKLVIQYSKPVSPAIHIHRIGRCARQQSNSEKQIGVAISLICPEDDEAFRVIRQMCSYDAADGPPSLTEVNYTIFDKLMRLTNQASLVIDSEQKLKNYLTQFRQVQQQQVCDAQLYDECGIDSSDDEDHMPDQYKSFATVARMLNSMKTRKQHHLGAIFQEITCNNRCKTGQKIEYDDVIELLLKHKYEADKIRQNLRTDIVRFKEQIRTLSTVYHAEQQKYNIILFQLDLRPISIPDQTNPLFRQLEKIDNHENCQQKNDRKLIVKSESIVRKQQIVKDRLQQQNVAQQVVINDAVIVDPLEALVRNTVEQEKKHENFKKRQTMYDKLHKKEENMKKREKRENALNMNNFVKLTKELANEVDGDFMQIGPKEQRSKKLSKYKGASKLAKKFID